MIIRRKLGWTFRLPLSIILFAVLFHYAHSYDKKYKHATGTLQALDLIRAVTARGYSIPLPPDGQPLVLPKMLWTRLRTGHFYPGEKRASAPMRLSEYIGYLNRRRIRRAKGNRESYHDRYEDDRYDDRLALDQRWYEEWLEKQEEDFAKRRKAEEKTQAKLMELREEIESLQSTLKAQKSSNGGSGSGYNQCRFLHQKVSTLEAHIQLHCIADGILRLENFAHTSAKPKQLVTTYKNARFFWDGLSEEFTLLEGPFKLAFINSVPSQGSTTLFYVKKTDESVLAVDFASKKVVEYPSATAQVDYTS